MNYIGPARQTSIRHCIAARLAARWLAACLALALVAGGWSGAQAQGSKAISLRDAQRWQQLQGDAEAQLAKGDYTQAEATAKQALAAGIAGFGAADPNVASSYSLLGAAQLKNSSLAEAENSFRQALAIYEKRFGPEHEFVGATLNNLGLVLERQGNFSNAELLLRRALAIKEKKQGKDNPDTAVTLANLARVLDREGKSGQLAQAGVSTPAAAAPAAPAGSAAGGSAEAQRARRASANRRHPGRLLAG